MNNRRFRRKATKGVLGVQDSLRYLYCEGAYEAERPKHAVIEYAVKKGWVNRVGTTLSLTEEGKRYVAKRYPNLVRHEDRVEDAVEQTV